MKKKILIIDCDPGIDDAFALFYAMADETLDLRLITTVSGNVSLEKTTMNARRIVAMASKDIEIAQGAEVPLYAPPVFADDVHGKNGMGDYKFKSDEKVAPLSSRDAIAAQYDVIMNAEEKVVIAAVGPLTNIAKLLMLHPEVKDKIEYLSIMGGGLKGGNTSICAEFNFYVDPEAAAYVFQSNVPIIMAGLDVTETAVLNKDHMEELSSLSPIGKFLYDVIRNMGVSKNLHDVIAIMAISNLDAFTHEPLFMAVETQGIYTRGMSIADRREVGKKDANATVILALDHPHFLKKLFEKIHSYN